MSDEINIEGLRRAILLFAEKAQKIYNDFFVPLSDWFEKNGEILIKVSESFLEVSLAIKASKKLGENQFVFWEGINQTLANQLLNSDSVDRTMLDFYEKDSFEQVENAITLCTQCKLIENRKKLFLQTISAYRENKFNLAIVGLMTVIDSVISEASSDSSSTFKGKLDKIKNKISLEQALTKEEISFMVLTNTIEETYSTMFCFSSFEGLEPVYINRHWIIHGRTTREYKKIDCIKVLNMLCGIILIDELSRKEEKEVEQVDGKQN